MDSTHLRFYDWQTAQSLVTGVALRIVDSESDGGFPGSRFLGPLGRALDRIGLRLMPGLFGTQFVFVCQLP